MRINRSAEVLVLLAVALWGNWAIYYWAMVIGLHASFADLRQWLPILLGQVLATMLLLMRQDLGLADGAGFATPPAGTSRSPERRGLLPASILLGLVLAGAALAVSALGWSGSPVGYNLLWALTVPLALAAYLDPRPALGRTDPVSGTAPARSETLLEPLGLIAALAIAMVALSALDRPSPDDAFYAHVITSTLAHPELPVQGQDLLLGTGAPYEIHPGYRVSGFEVLAALIGDLTGIDPLRIYMDLYPLVGAVLWVLVGHLFLRSLGIPYPGVGVLVALLVLLHWLSSKSLGVWFTSMHMGKAQVAAILAPLLFMATSIFSRRPSPATWLLLLLSISAVAAWSSSGLFIVPVAVLVATAVYLPIQPRSLIRVGLIGLTLLPMLLVTLDSLRVAALFPPNTEGGSGTGPLFVSGQSLGGIWTQSLLLLTLLILPLLATGTDRQRMRPTLARFGLAGALSLYAPYWIEIVAVQGEMFLVSWRLQWAFPSALIPGVLGGLAAARLMALRDIEPAHRWRVGVVIALALGLWVAAFIGSLDERTSLVSRHAKVKAEGRMFEDDLREARAARALIQSHGLVAPGHLNAYLPMLPDPPTFVSVRHYLAYHRNLLGEKEYWQRMFIAHATERLALLPDDRPEPPIDRIVFDAKQLGVSTLVFRTAPEPGQETEVRRQAEVIEALTRALEQAGYHCATTASGRTRVCNSPLGAAASKD
jgi:hypothetical protein